jgi:hypothetical protein
MSAPARNPVAANYSGAAHPDFASLIRATCNVRAASSMKKVIYEKKDIYGAA